MESRKIRYKRGGGRQRCEPDPSMEPGRDVVASHKLMRGTGVVAVKVSGRRASRSWMAEGVAFVAPHTMPHVSKHRLCARGGGTGLFC